MTKGVKISIAAAAAVFIISAVMAIFMWRSPKSDRVVILRDDEVLYTLDLSSEKDRTITVSCPDGGYNTVEIKEGRIRISEADCPDKTCVRSGYLDSAGLPIVCLPHRLVVRYE